MFLLKILAGSGDIRWDLEPKLEEGLASKVKDVQLVLNPSYPLTYLLLIHMASIMSQLVKNLPTCKSFIEQHASKVTYT